jgi:G patch domain-containing protein 1
MLPAPKDSAGARILMKMGWRLGQGIGPRVTLRQRKMQDLQASSGQNLTGYDIDIPDDDEEANKHTYAPRDTPILLVERKDNYHGLGYRPGMGLNESLGVKDNVGVAGLKVSGASPNSSFQ